MSQVLNLIARLVFVAAVVLLLLGLLAVGLVLGLVWWLVALLTGRQRPSPQIWVQRFQQQARGAMRPRDPARGEVIDVDVKEVR